MRLTMWRPWSAAAPACAGPSSRRRPRSIRGLPVLETSLTRIENGRLFYRGSTRSNSPNGARSKTPPSARRRAPERSVRDPSLAIEAFPAKVADSKPGLSDEGDRLSERSRRGNDGREDVAAVLRAMAAAGAGSDPERRPDPRAIWLRPGACRTRRRRSGGALVLAPTMNSAPPRSRSASRLRQGHPCGIPSSRVSPP